MQVWHEQRITVGVACAGQKASWLPCLLAAAGWRSRRQQAAAATCLSARLAGPPPWVGGVEGHVVLQHTGQEESAAAVPPSLAPASLLWGNLQQQVILRCTQMETADGRCGASATGDLQQRPAKLMLPIFEYIFEV